MKVWYLLIKPSGEPFGNLDKVTLSDDDDVANLKDKIKEKNPDLKHVAPRNLDVLRCNDKATATSLTLRQQVTKVISEQKAEGLDPRQSITDLQLSKDEILLVQVPTSDNGEFFSYVHR